MKELANLYFEPWMSDLWQSLYKEIEIKIARLRPEEENWTYYWSISKYGPELTLHIRAKSDKNKRVNVKRQVKSV